MAAINQVGNTLTGSTGTGSFVGATSPTITAPNIVNAINDVNGNTMLQITPVASAVNYFEIGNGPTGVPPEFASIGTDTNISITMRTKGTGSFAFVSADATTPLTLYNGTGSQHATNFVFANTSAVRGVTFPDADGTVTLLGNSSTGSGSVVLSTSPTLTTPVLGAATATSINFGQTTLNNYQEGTWTPTDNSGASLAFTSVVANYTRIGRMVIATCTLTYPSTVSGASAAITGLPFTSANSNGSIGGVISYSNASTLFRGLVIKNSTNMNLYTSAGVQILNSALTLSNNYFIAIYFV